MNHLIIGGGPAALSAAATLRRVESAARVTILSREMVPPYAKMALPYLLAGRIEEKDLFLSVPAGVDLLLGEEAIRIAAERREVETAGGKVFPYDRLLIASGGSPEKPKIEGGNLPFVFTIRDLPDIVGIRERIQGKTGRAVIAGAGPVGMETGEALRELGMSLTFVVTSDRVFSTMLDAPAAGVVAGKLREEGVEILTGEDIAMIRENGEAVLRSGGTRACDLVIFGKGVKPTVAFLAGSGIAVEQGIVVDERQETNIPGIYAAGDAARTRDIVHGDSRVNALWPAAVEQGRVAALNMAGVPAAYPGSLARNILRVFGVSVYSAGAGRAEKGYEIRTMEGPGLYRKIVLDGGVLKGLIFIGEVRNEGLYASLIGKGADVSAYAGSLLQGSYGYSRHLARACRHAA
jgi:NADPH-dependent 2,4-dienoyl-CoA reductase/sulfur reductase-like enzyme